MFVYSGGLKAKQGVDFIIHPDISSYILDINNYSDMIISLTIKREAKTKIYIQLYALCNDNYNEN
jgi:hypothetical protein